MTASTVLPEVSKDVTVDTANVPASYLERIRAMRPDLDVRTARVNGEGLANDVVLVNDAWVFRFAKGDWGPAALQDELVVLKLLHGRLPLAIPEPIAATEDAVHYRWLPGMPLTRWLWAGLDELTRNRVAGQLGGFLRALHAAPADALLPRVTPEVKRERWRERRAQIEATVYPLLMAHQREWAARLFDDALEGPGALDFAPVLVHDDLAPYHILFDPIVQALSAAIDFGTAHYDDPAADFGGLLQHYGEAFVQRMLRAYPEAAAMLPRARFYAQAIELDWVALGLTRNEAFWFTSHLGNSREIQLPISQ